MDMRLIERDGIKYTHFKLTLKEYPLFKKLLSKFGITVPIKQSSRFVHFEAQGDYLNSKSEVEGNE